MIGYIKDQDLLDLLDENGRSILTAAKINRLERVYFPAELHVGDRAWKKAMSILDKKYAEAKKMPFVRDPLAWALYHTWKEFDDGKRCVGNDFFGEAPQSVSAAYPYCHCGAKMDGGNGA